MENAFVVLRSAGYGVCGEEGFAYDERGFLYVFHQQDRGFAGAELRERLVVAATDEFQEAAVDIGIICDRSSLRRQGRSNCRNLAREIFSAHIYGKGKKPEFVGEDSRPSQFTRVCLLDQPFIKEQTLSVSAVNRAEDAKMGETSPYVVLLASRLAIRRSPSHSESSC